MPQDFPTLADLEAFARDAKITAIKHFTPFGVTASAKGDSTPLTLADNEINQAFIAWAADRFRMLQIFGEEKDGATIVGAKRRAMIDPIDGTIQFSSGLLTSTTIIAVFEDGKPIQSVIVDHGHDRIWSAQRGMGAFCNGVPIRVSKQNRLERVKGEPLTKLWAGTWVGAPMKNLESAIVDLIRAGVVCECPFTLGLYGGLTAMGLYDGTIFPNTDGHETGAMALLVEEAGGRATDIFGRELVYGPRCEVQGHIITNGLIHDKIVEIVGRHVTQ